MDLLQLREATRPEHEATEAAMPLMEPGLTLVSYRLVLRTLLPIVRSWEAWSAEHAPPSLQPLLPPRQRGHLLEADLCSLGEFATPDAAGGGMPIDWATVTQMHENCAIPGDVDSWAAREAAFLGALYVLEGSTLGGRIIARHLESRFGFPGGAGNAYFRGHGEQTGALWRETTAVIAALPDEYSEDAIEAARRTFHAYRTALEALGPAFPEEPAQSRLTRSAPPASEQV